MFCPFYAFLLSFFRKIAKSPACSKTGTDIPDCYHQKKLYVTTLALKINSHFFCKSHNCDLEYHV